METPYRLHQGDALEVLRTLEPESIDGIITDPPYGIDLQPQRGLTDAIANDTRSEARALWEATVPELYRVAKPDTAHLFFSGWSETWTKEVLEQHFTVKACIVWVKNVWGIGYYTRPQHEFIWYCHKGKPPKPQTPRSNVWSFARVHAPRHSCEKPENLMRECVLFTTNPGDTVLDPFTGSGSTGVAALQEGRRFIGAEIDPNHHHLAVTRLEAAQAQPRLIPA